MNLLAQLRFLKFKHLNTYTSFIYVERDELIMKTKKKNNKRGFFGLFGCTKRKEGASSRSGTCCFFFLSRRPRTTRSRCWYV